MTYESGKWESVIGLEIHVQLMTASKIFSGASTAYGAAPNTQACAVSIALPGVLPVMNREAARLAVKFGLSIGAKINRKSVFARKNYFYPDLPKGYQISQFELPIVGEGEIAIEVKNGGADGNGDAENGGGYKKIIGITRAHLEEDAGKSLHEDFRGMTGIDLNRAGTPLLEIVSEPDMRSAAEAVAYLRKIHTLVRYLDISDGNMQEGSFRCDANVSVRPVGQKELATRTELKNINSFRFVEKAIEFEIARQIQLLEEGGEVVQETRLYDADRDETRAMRSKEEAHDYRYFPDPDLPAMMLEECFIDAVRASLPELPDVRKQRFITDFALDESDAANIAGDRATADYFERTCEKTQADAKSVANWINGELSAALNNSRITIEASQVSAEQLATLLNRIADNTLSGKIAKDVFNHLWQGEAGEAGEPKGVDEIIAEKGLKQITDSAEIESIIDKILEQNAAQVQQYQDGNQKVFGFFVGQAMKLTQGRANPQQVNEMLKNKLD